MKRCSACNRTYEDGSLNFCLADGAPLMAIDSEATVVIPRPAEKKKSKLLIWLGLGVLVIAAVVIVLASVLVYRFSGTDRTSRNDNQTNRQASLASPRPKASPTATVPPAESNSDQSFDADPTPSVEDSDDITPILWDTTAGGFKGTPGTTYTFQCPKDGAARSIFGSDVYTDYSSICTAAVHAGVITLKDGGVIVMEYRPGRQIYGSTVRNDVTSITTGEHTRSFVIRPGKKE